MPFGSCPNKSAATLSVASFASWTGGRREEGADTGARAFGEAVEASAVREVKGKGKGKEGEELLLVGRYAAFVQKWGYFGIVFRFFLKPERESVSLFASLSAS
mmetsp:Transcript_15553/g.31576  ORF Transcript_15553/g.31576 Transcript_15553/m.31576 type:complete len:103 (-) Transcript_15553:538-846(-)